MISYYKHLTTLLDPYLEHSERSTCYCINFFKCNLHTFLALHFDFLCFLYLNVFYRRKMGECLDGLNFDELCNLEDKMENTVMAIREKKVETLTTLCKHCFELIVCSTFFFFYQ